MTKINRAEFLKLGSIGLIVGYSSLTSWANGMVNTHNVGDNELYQLLIRANDQTVSFLLNEEIKKESARSLSVQFGILTASFCTTGSVYFNSQAVSQQLLKNIKCLLLAQNSNGTIDAGGNRQSPPDTAFLIDNLGPAAKLITKTNLEESAPLQKLLDRFLKQAGEALLIGGVHTPNHRWVISSALAHLYDIYRDKRYLERIDEWLSEGVFIDEDGQYPERSRIYSKVVDEALINIATILGRPELLDSVKKNLESTFYLMEENGDLISVDSRRQDQNFNVSQTYYYWSYRFMAVRFNSPFFAMVSRKIENDSLFANRVLSGSLIYFLDMSVLQEKLPDAEELPREYVSYFSSTNLTRIKRNQITATIFGGNDFPLYIASGRSTNPTFFTFRKGEAILEYVRLSTSFFNTGYFRSQGLKQEQDSWKLHERKEAYYYQPLAKTKQNRKGGYEFSESKDNRFWSKMDFNQRSVSNIQAMETNIAIQEHNGEFELAIQIEGVEGVEVSLELCFRAGGQLSHVQESDSKGDFFLKNGYATYQFGSDIIEVGPGIMAHQHVDRIDGELYSTHFGSVKGDGVHLYLTGYTPFSHTVTIK